MQAVTSSSEETIALGQSFAARLRPGDLVALTGPLGTGKTRFVQGVCEGLVVRVHVGSPTFTLINEYPAPFGTVVHVDLYRIRSAKEVAELGLQEYFNEGCICLIEWPETAAAFLPQDHYCIRLSHGKRPDERIITIERNEG